MTTYAAHCFRMVWDNGVDIWVDSLSGLYYVRRGKVVVGTVSNFDDARILANI